jgi:DNA polymerase/3'-5' exonuclease PolX
MKTKRHYTDAIGIALEVVDLLRPACETIEIAGSLRRECALIGDIELVAVPRYATNLLGEPDGLQLDWLFAEHGIKPSKDGQRYKQFAYQDMQVDLFLADRENLGYILMLRTGPADYSKALVTAQPWGLKPPHIRVAEGYVYSYPTNDRISLPTEAALCAAWGMDYLPPQARK